MESHGTTTWQWAKSSDGNTDWANVGTNSLSYTTVEGDVGSYLRATASYTDGHGPSKTANAKTAQTVRAGTNRVPEFGLTSTTRDVAENTPADQPVGAVVEATDLDTGDTLTYSMSGGDAGLFDFDTGTGQIKVKAGMTLDYEGTRKSYTVAIEVTDGKDADGASNPAMDDTIVVTINVTDVNEAPEFDSKTATRSIAENSVAATNVGAVITATDPDADASLTYSLSGADAGSFTIDSTGQIKVGASPTLDYESAKKGYTVNVDVRDSKDAAGDADTATDDTIEVTISVTNVNEQPAFPSDETGARSIPENTSAAHPIGDPVEAADPENDTLTYSLGGTDASSFDIDTSNGQLKTKAALDKETKDTYEVTVSVHDGYPDSTVDDTIDVTITVTDANDPPTVSGKTTVNHAENDAGTVATYSATDPEGVTSFTWTLSGDDADDFAINGGALTFSSTPNFEAATDIDNDNVYLVTVEASDGTVKGTLDVTVTVTGVNEDPEFDEGPTTTRIVSENTGTNQDIGNPIAATDPDDGDTLIYSLDSTSAATFSIDTSNGQLKTKAALNKEATATYTVTVSVKDIQTDAIPDDTITVTITVTDANEPPEFPSTEDGTRSFPENTGANVNVGSAVTANDPDTGATLTYTLEGADTASFEIDDTSGQIKTKAGVTYDYEATPRYSITVRADDGEGGTDTKEVTINVTDVDEPPLKPGTPTVSRTSNTAVSVTWTAPDNTGRPPILHYQYQYKKSAETLGSGEVFTTSGPILSVTIITLEPGTSYDFQVWAVNDEGPGPWSDTGTGSTNSPPDFSAATADREVDENTTGVTIIGAPVTATDDDSDTLAYTLEGADANSFQIISTSGQIQTKAGETYDHEAKPSYTVTVKANDSNGGTATIAVTITVTDLNEAPAFDDVSPTSREIPENTVADTSIGDPVAATDQDDGATLTYSLGGTDVSSFGIDTSNGQLKTKAMLDHETKATYTVTVSVRDSKDAAGSSDTTDDDEITVTIIVTDANDPPEFPSTESGTRSVPENTVSNTNIGSPVRATDADNDKLTYTLEGTDHGSFDIDESSGQLKTKSPLDHEGKESYTVTVKASDGNNGVATKDVTITITDVNEAPSFGSETATRNVPENTAANEPVGPVVDAKDPDDGDSLAYSLGGTDSASFGINDSTGQITVGTGTTPDFETKASYQVTVTATDSSNLSDTITVTINVTAGNDPPIFATDTATRRVAENTGTAQNMGAPFKATDAEQETLTYTLEGTDAASFGIVSTSGQLQTKAALDYEAKSSYSVIVKAEDTSSGSGTIDVTITVTDVNEPPQAPGQPGVSEASASSVTVTWTAPANAWPTVHYGLRLPVQENG